MSYLNVLRFDYILLWTYRLIVEQMNYYNKAPVINIYTFKDSVGIAILQENIKSITREKLYSDLPLKFSTTKQSNIWYDKSLLETNYIKELEALYKKFFINILIIYLKCIKNMYIVVSLYKNLIYIVQICIINIQM